MFLGISTIFGYVKKIDNFSSFFYCCSAWIPA
jgi:hypothetical protein